MINRSEVERTVLDMLSTLSLLAALAMIGSFVLGNVYVHIVGRRLGRRNGLFGNATLWQARGAIIIESELRNFARTTHDDEVDRFLRVLRLIKMTAVVGAALFFVTFCVGITIQEMQR